MGAVKSLINVLRLRTGARWITTGGGCMAIEIQFGEKVGSEVWRYEILITDRDDTFSRADYHLNDDVTGFHALLRVFADDSGDDVYGDRDPVVVYRTSDDAGTCYSVAGDGVPCVDLRAEVDRCAVAVENVVEMVLRAERDGRSLRTRSRGPRSW